MNLDFISPDSEYTRPVSACTRKITKYSISSSSPTRYLPLSSFKTPTKAQKRTQSHISESLAKSIRLQTTSKKILNDVLEQDWSVNSASKQKRMKILRKSIQVTSQSSEKSGLRASPDKGAVERFSNYYLESNPFESNKDMFEARYKNVRDCEFGDVEKLDLDLKVIKYLEFIKSPCKDLKFSALFCINSIIKATKAENVIQMILDTLFTSLEDWEDQDDEFLECVLFIIGECGNFPISMQKLQTIGQIMHHDETSTHESLYSSAFACLFNLGPLGIKYLISAASNEQKYLKNWILERLLLTNTIQKSILVPALAQDILNSPVGIKELAMLAMSRMYTVVADSGVVAIFEQTISGFGNKILPASILRICGTMGEKSLIRLLKTHQNQDVRVACIQALSFSCPEKPKQITILLEDDSKDYTESILPGSLWKYKGPTVSILEDPCTEAVLAISPRDFLAALQRWSKGESLSFSTNAFPLLPESMKMTERSVSEFSEPGLLSVSAIRAICMALRDPSAEVKKTAVQILAEVSIPEALDSVDCLIRALKDNEPQVRAMAAWAIGRLGNDSTRACSELIPLLKDEYLQVRNAACLALSSAGRPAAKTLIPLLIKKLKDGSINRNYVAETIVKLGPDGEKKVIEIMMKEPIGNLVIRTSIIRALGFSNVDSNTVDYVIEILFKLSTENTPVIRKESLLSLKSIADRANNKLVYLKPNSLMPLYMKFLKDPCKEIRDICIQCIIDLGPQGEMMLIEAFTKDMNHIIRAQAAKGLGLIGPSQFRTLILGLHDEHFYVRNSTARAISKNFTVEGILAEFANKNSQKQSLKCAIKEAINLPYPLSFNCESILKCLLGELENQI